MDYDETLHRLQQDFFRRKFRLGEKERAHVERWGIDRVLQQAREILLQRVAPADPRNDGRQTPWRNHPVFVAQHATATCCRSCLLKWHGVAKGVELAPEDLANVIGLIGEWIARDMKRGE